MDSLEARGSLQRVSSKDGGAGGMDVVLDAEANDQSFGSFSLDLEANGVREEMKQQQE